MLKILCLVLIFEGSQITIPEKAPFVLEWQHERTEPGEYYQLNIGKKVIQTIRTNEFKVVSVTNGIATLRATIVRPVPRGTNQLSLLSVSTAKTNWKS